MVILPTFGQQTQASHGGTQIYPSFYLCWGTKAKKSSCYERLNFEQPACKAKAEWKEGPWLNEEESES